MSAGASQWQARATIPWRSATTSRTLFAAATSFTGGRVFPVLSRDASRAAGFHCSDHKKAQAVGRKLNTLMAELKMNSKEPMSKAQLQKLCEHERDVMRLHLEDVSIAARRNGRPADI